MLLVYQPVPAVAYDSVLALSGGVRFGALVRGVHYWSANLLIAVVLLHVARVVLTGGHHRPRRLNWAVGAALLVGVLASAFTGYLLPWDQRAFWAVTISTGMLSYVPWLGDTLQAIARGGREIGADTLLTYYTYHTTVLPVLAVGLMAFHFWRVRKAGGVVEPPAAEKDDGRDEPKVMFFPDLLVREIAQAMVVLAVVVALGATVGASIGDRANPGTSPNPAKAPWYFMGFQELLIHLHPVFAVLLLPMAALAGFVALPWLGNDDGPAGRWFLSPAAKRASAIAADAGIAICTVAAVLDDILATPAGGGPGWVVRGVVPTVLFAAVTAIVAVVTRRRFDLGRNESVQTVVVFLAATFVTLTVVGVFFRGAGMALTVPWGG
jgi:quinol-cytochrome oxidoreductase complex cytochrome b subunit